MLTSDQIRETADAIAARQQSDGRLPWHTEQHTDPWNHIEAAMGLALGGRFDAADLAWEWLLRTQQRDGAWAQSYAWDGSILDPDADTNARTRSCRSDCSGTPSGSVRTASGRSRGGRWTGTTPCSRA